MLLVASLRLGGKLGVEELLVKFIKEGVNIQSEEKVVIKLHYSDEDSMTRPLLLVTASVDKMVLKETITVGL
ncbi:hypothetical protein L2E82_41367 [Cichorium intybus]|uniref:Uncharacterized protein n=1 Tax=Cichorium intybus TaxID=13427 RepID=A0ACB9AMA4_CICIN|nr:hypothetical protein L2E82_41367 [Cichorium intybus]